jgi:hypothetical protein
MNTKKAEEAQYLHIIIHHTNVDLIWLKRFWFVIMTCFIICTSTVLQATCYTQAQIAEQQRIVYIETGLLALGAPSLAAGPLASLLWLASLALLARDIDTLNEMKANPCCPTT